MTTYCIFEVSKQTDMNTLRYNKKTEVKFETSKDFLTANKNLVLNTLKTEFYFYLVDMKTLAIDYFSYVQNSDYNEKFTLVISKKIVARFIELSVKNFKKQYRVLPQNHTVVNDFVEERRKAGFASKSF